MEPNNQDSNYSIDYLNQIAAKPRRRFPLNKIQILVISLITVLVIVATAVILNLGRSTNNLQRLAERLNATSTIIAANQDKLRDADLRSLSTSLGLYITSAESELQPILDNKNISISSKKSTPTDLLVKLEDADLNGILDRTYAREMAYHLAITLSILDQIQKSGDSATKVLAEKISSNLSPTQEGFESFQSASS